MKESDLQTQVCEYLALRKAFFWRQNTAPTVQRLGNGEMVFRKMGKYSLRGIPDIIIITDGGYAVFLELKSEKGTLSPDQKIFQEQCEKVGAEYHVIKNLNQVIELGL